MGKQDETQKTRMEKACGLLGLKMHQLFNISNRNGIQTGYTEGGPYFFTECGICGEDGELKHGLLESLLMGGMDAEPLDGYRYKHADTVDASKILGRKVKTEVASLEAIKRSKALYAVTAAGEQGTMWRVELREEGKHPRCTEFTDLAQAAEFYNSEKLVRLQYD